MTTKEDRQDVKRSTKEAVVPNICLLGTSRVGVAKEIDQGKSVTTTTESKTLIGRTRGLATQRW